MNRYKLLIDSIRGRTGEVVEIDPSEAETIGILTRNGIIGAPLSSRQPEVTKVDEPTEVKRRGRPPRHASDSAN
jgi:hypothetical protein